MTILQGRTLVELRRDHVEIALIWLREARDQRSTLTGRQHAYLLAKAAWARRSALAVTQTIEMVRREHSESR
jgi:hypothetical protein